MKLRRNLWLILIVCVFLLAAGIGSANAEVLAMPQDSTAQIYLYGEQHGEKAIMDKEFELWKTHYDSQNMRHLFVELPYYSAEFLNLWMQADTDAILLETHADTEGTASHVPETLEFYRQIKRECPETVFHGTDVGHQYETTGARFIEYLEQNGMKDTEQYALAQEVIEQGREFYQDDDFAYREDIMAQNFIRAFDALDGESVMGIYGGAHTGLDVMDYNTGTVPNMATQLAARYGDAVHTEDLYWVLKDIAPIREDEITVDGKTYTASYFGKEDMTGFGDFTYREFWRLEDAYDDFKDYPTNEDVLPYDNYPMLIEVGEVFVVDIGFMDGSMWRLYYRSDGNTWQGMDVTEQFVVE